MTIRAKIEELKQTIQDELGVVIDIDIWVHRSSNKLSPERALEVAERFAKEIDCPASTRINYDPDGNKYVNYSCNSELALVSIFADIKKELQEAAN